MQEIDGPKLAKRPCPLVLLSGQCGRTDTSSLDPEAGEWLSVPSLPFVIEISLGRIKTFGYICAHARVESLGQVCWDRDLTHEVPAPIRIENSIVQVKIFDNSYVKDVQIDALCSWFDLDPGVGQRIPHHGTIVWWFGHKGDKVAIYND